MTPQEKYRINNREKVRDRMRAWRAANPDKSREHGRNHYHAKIARLSPEELRAFRAADIARARVQYQKRKDAIFSAYGGYVCKCCGEKEKFFLSIDHIENDGAKMVKEGKYKRGSAYFYNWLIKNNFPKGFQVLCMNCQFGKKNNGGMCPHQVKV